MSKFSVKKPLTVFVAVIAILVLGVVAFTNMTPDLLPNMNLPYVVIVTPYPGATPQKVEMSVTKPLEQSMATLENIQNITSTSSENMSTIVLEFGDDVNMDSVTVDILQSITRIQPYWDDMVGSPFIMKLNPSMLPVMVAAVNMEGMDNYELSAFMENTLLNKLEGIDGVASVSASGVIEEKVHVVLRQDKIDAKNARIALAVEGEFADVISELEETKTDLDGKLADINSAQSKLEGGIGELAEQSADGGAQINQAQMEMLEGKIVINQNLTELKTQLAELESQQAIMVQLRDALAAMGAVGPKLEGWEAALTPPDGEIYVAEQAAVAAVAAAYDAENGAGEWDNLSIAEKQAVLQADSGYQEFLVSSGIAEILETLQMQYFDSTLALLGVKALKAEYDTIMSTLAALDIISVEQLDDAINQMEAAKPLIRAGVAQLEGLLEQIEGGQVPLTDAMKELDSIKTTTQFELGTLNTQLMLGEAQLSSAISEIEKGLEQIEEAKESAISQTDLNNILTMDMVSQILVAQNFSMPVGYVEKDGEQSMVSIGETLTSVDELRELVILDLGMEGLQPIYLKDVADVYVSDNAETIYAKIDGSDGVLLSFSKQSNAATAAASDNIQAKFTQLSEEYPGLNFYTLMDQGDYIYIVVNTILKNLLLGALFAIIILFLFLKDIRPTFITLCSIPISVIFAIALMYFSGVTLNIISLSGLAVAVGMLVDNSVVVIENIYRLRAQGHSAVRSAVSGASQVAGAIAASTLTTICVFLPIVFVEGITKTLFTDMALTLGYALGASLIVALTLVPAMSSKMLKNAKEKPSKLLEKISGAYAKGVKWALGHKILVMVVVVIMLFVSYGAVMMRGFSFMPEMSMPELSVSVRFPEGTTFEEAKQMTDDVLERISPIEGIETTGAMMDAGSALGGIMGGGGGSSGGDTPTSATIYALLDKKNETRGTEIGNEINEACADFPAKVSASASSGMSMDALTGSGISINLFGDDLDELQDTAKAVADVLRGLEGTGDVNNGIGDTSPEIRFIVDKEKAMEKGLTTAQVYMEVASALTTEKTSTSLSYGVGEHDVLILKDDGKELTPDFVMNYEWTYTDPMGEEQEVALRDIARIEHTETKNAINRDNQRRTLEVSAKIAEGHNVTLVTADAEKAMEGFELPPGMTYEFAGENENIMEAMKQLVLMLLLGVLLVYLIMAAQFQSLKSPFIVMFTIPLAFTGGLLGLFVTGLELSIVALIGFVMLVGIIVNNGIVLVDYINQLRQDGMPREEAIIEAGITRLRPILMTSLTTILGLLVMAFGRGVGSELMQPVAIVSIGGLLYATLLTLFVIPVMYSTVNRKEIEVINEEDLLVVDD